MTPVPTRRFLPPQIIPSSGPYHLVLVYILRSSCHPLVPFRPEEGMSCRLLDGLSVRPCCKHRPSPFSKERQHPVLILSREEAMRASITSLIDFMLDICSPSGSSISRSAPAFSPKTAPQALPKPVPTVLLHPNIPIPFLLVLPLAAMRLLLLPSPVFQLR